MFAGLAEWCISVDSGVPRIGRQARVFIIQQRYRPQRPANMHITWLVATNFFFHVT